MIEKTIRKLNDLKARQKAGEHMRCPRCGADTMKDPVHTNALSRSIDLYICDACGTTEAMLAFMHQSYPVTSWAALQPDKPRSDFREMTASEVLMAVTRKQVDMLTLLYECCRDDPEHALEYRLEAFESCPGLTELWTHPFQAKYSAKNGSVLFRFKTSEEGALLMTADIIDK